MSVGPPFLAAVLISKDTIITFKDTAVTFKDTVVTFKNTNVTFKYTIVFVIATWEKTGKLLRRQHSQAITIYPSFLFVFSFATRIFSLLNHGAVEIMPFDQSDAACSIRPSAVTHVIQNQFTSYDCQYVVMDHIGFVWNIKLL